MYLYLFFPHSAFFASFRKSRKAICSLLSTAWTIWFLFFASEKDISDREWIVFCIFWTMSVKCHPWFFDIFFFIKANLFHIFSKEKIFFLLVRLGEIFFLSFFFGSHRRKQSFFVYFTLNWIRQMSDKKI